MSVLRLYATSGSLYCAKVRIALRSKGVVWEEVAPEGGYRSAAYRQRVPQGTVPALEVDGQLIVDSEAIIEYLEEAYPALPLLPADPIARAQVRSLSRFHDTSLEPAIRALFRHIRAATLPSDDQVDRLISRLAILGQIAKPAPFLGGETLSIADCGYPVSFATLDIIAPRLGIDLIWPPDLQLYRAVLASAPAVEATLAPYRLATTAWADTLRDNHAT